MSKRTADIAAQEGVSLKQGDRPIPAHNGDEEVGPFEDDYEDEFESEDEIMVAGEDGLPDDDKDADQDGMEVDQPTFIPGRNKLPEGQIMQPDDSVYEMRHGLSVGWPCLSFDILRDHLGEDRARKKYPATVYAVAGTQADGGAAKDNEILVMKLSKLGKMERDDDSLASSSDEDSDDDENTDPILETRHIKLGTCTNRIRAKELPPSSTRPSKETYTATMTESGLVMIHNITPHLASFDVPGAAVGPAQNTAVHFIRAHNRSEGFALDWAPATDELRLATGDVAGNIYVTARDAAGKWNTDPKPFAGHTASVEELQWSPTEATVFASASADGTIRIWDTRAKSHRPKITVAASTTDVNVLSWSPLQPYLLASGADDGRWAVWDLRQWRPAATPAEAIKPSPIASFNFHKEQVTSVEWHPKDDSIVAVCAGDNTLTLWDLAVELDDEESRYTAGVADVPPQLLFVHYMKGVKECHWHPQAPGQIMATGEEGFGVFKTISI